MTRLSPQHVVRPALAVIGLSAVIIAGVLALRLPQSFVDPYIDEDGLAESAGAVFLLLASGLMLALFARARRAHPEVRESRTKRLSYLALALLFFLAAGEEISWGQRILGYGTPEAIKEVNSQGEVNLHNLGGDEGGQNVSWRIFQAFWLTWGIAIPIAAAASRRLRRTAMRFIPILPVWLALLFAGQQALWKPVEANWRSDPSAWNGSYRPAIGEEAPPRIESLAEAKREGIDGPAGLGEVMESVVQLLLFVSALTLFLGARGRAPAPPPGESRIRNDAPQRRHDRGSAAGISATSR